MSRHLLQQVLRAAVLTAGLYLTHATAHHLADGVSARAEPSAPLQLEEDAAPAEVSLTVPDEGRFRIDVVFRWRDDSVQEAVRAFHVLGARWQRGVDEKPRQQGVPGEFSVQVLRAGDRAVVYRDTVVQPATSPSYLSRYATLATVTLPPGSYRVRVTGRSNSQDVRALSADLAVVPVAGPK